MKRFYKDVSVQPDGDMFAILLDNRPVKTPARKALKLPTAAMAETVAREWEAQDEEIDPAAMVMTGIANAALDHVLPDLPRFAEPVIAYGETDMLCYRADPDTPLSQRQSKQWEPLLLWAEQRYDIKLHRVEGITYKAQPAESLARLKQAVLSQDGFVLAGLSQIVSLTGSLVAGLYLLSDGDDPEQIWNLSNLEEMWQVEQWGEDAEAIKAREMRKSQFDAAVQFCNLCKMSGEH